MFRYIAAGPLQTKCQTQANSCPTRSNQSLRSTGSSADRDRNSSGCCGGRLEDECKTARSTSTSLAQATVDAFLLQVSDRDSQSATQPLVLSSLRPTAHDCPAI